MRSHTSNGLNQYEGLNKTLSFQYDANGNRTRVTHPDGQYFTYDYDDLNRLFKISNPSTGGIIQNSYNTRGLVSIQYSAAANTWFSFDPVSRLSGINRDVDGSSYDINWTYTRNPASQILTETQSTPDRSPGQASSYSWDGHATINRAYTVNGLNQYESAGGASFCYDESFVALSLRCLRTLAISPPMARASTATTLRTVLRPRSGQAWSKSAYSRMRRLRIGIFTRRSIVLQ